MAENHHAGMRVHVACGMVHVACSVRVHAGMGTNWRTSLCQYSSQGCMRGACGLLQCSTRAQTRCRTSSQSSCSHGCTPHRGHTTTCTACSVPTMQRAIHTQGGCATCMF